MGSLRPSHWPLILILLHTQLGKVQKIDSASQILRRLNKQFQQFQALFQARLDVLALNQNRNSTWGLETRVQALNEHYHHMSQDLEHLKQTTMREIEGLREQSRKLEKKTKRMEGRLASLQRNLKENLCHDQKQRPDPSQDLLNLTVEFQNQEERLGALQDQRDELLLGLQGLQESLKNQALRVTQLEGRLGEVLQLNGGGSEGRGRGIEPISSPIKPQEYYEPRRRTQTHRGGRPEAQKPRPQLQIQNEYSNPKAQFQDYLPHSGPHRPQSQIQVQTQTQPYPIQQDRLHSRKTVPYHPTQIQTHVQQPTQPQPHLQRQHQSKTPSHPSLPKPLFKAQSHHEPTKDRQSRTKVGDPQTQASDFDSESHQPQSSRWKGEQEEQNITNTESSIIHSLLQLPVRHKIPAQPVPKRDATICNVDFMLVFPSASAENYVTFSSTLPDLPEFSACLWLRVKASYFGTLLSYATHNNDNELVLYGRNSSPSLTSFPGSSSSSSQLSYGSSSFSPSSQPFASSPSLDFVIGDPVYRQLLVSSLLDTHWHHLCVLWSSIQGRFWHYNDRRLISSDSNFRKGWEISGGGSVVLGQEQDSVGGGFDPAESFVGQLAGFRVWNRVLSPSEVEGVAEGRGVPRGVVLDMEDIKEVHGEVQQVACECLEHCV